MAPFRRPLRDIYWMSSPLSIEKRETWTDKLRDSRYVPRNVRDFVDPTTDRLKGGYGFYPKIKHWTLQVDDVCYELWPKYGNKKVIPFTRITFNNLVFQGTDMCEPQVKDAAEWREYREKHNINVDKRKVGQTKMTNKQIEKAYKEIWKDFNQENYEFFTQNCQNFTAMLYRCIVVDVSGTERQGWEEMPQPAGHWLANVGQFGLAAQVGGYATYGLAVADAAALTVDGAATSTATTATAATATTTASTTEGAGIATAGTTHGTASATAAKGAGVGVGKAGIGAKFAALGPKAAIAAKGAAGLAMVHPVTGTLAAGTFIYIAARGARDKRWKRKGGREDGEDLDEEPSVEDMLEAEEMFLERAENPNAKMDGDLDEALAQGMEGLELTQVTTEPGPMPEGASIVEGSPADDSRRAHTVI